MNEQNRQQDNYVEPMQETGLELTQMERLVAGYILPNISNFVNYGIMSAEEYNTFIATIDEDRIESNLFVKFIEDELPEEIEQDYLVAFYETGKGDVIIEASYSYLVRVLIKAAPDAIDSEMGAKGFLDMLSAEEKTREQHLAILLNHLAEAKVEKGSTNITTIYLNNILDNKNIQNADGASFPAFQISFSKIYLIFKHPDVRVKNTDGEWLIVNKDMTPNDFARLLITHTEPNAFSLRIAIR